MSNPRDPPEGLGVNANPANGNGQNGAGNGGGGGIFGGASTGDSENGGDATFGKGGGSIANTNPNAARTLLNSTVSANTGANNLNQTNNGGGIESKGAVNIVNSTVSGNFAGRGTNAAGGITAPRGLITNSTVTEKESSGANETQVLFAPDDSFSAFVKYVFPGRAKDKYRTTELSFVTNN